MCVPFDGGGCTCLQSCEAITPGAYDAGFDGGDCVAAMLEDLTCLYNACAGACP
jgi:hypothetical protein